MSLNLKEKIQSLNQNLNINYVKPNIELIDKYCKSLTNTSYALDYLQIQRGFTNETILNFKLGYCEEKNAISIPIYKRGELVNIKYRHLDPKATAKYSQERGCEVWVFNDDGFEKGKARGSILITEGEFDAMSAWQSGFKSVISPASGKDSYGIWLELLDTIPKVFVAFDNDKPGKKTSIEFAERVGTEKCFEIIYPEGIKDANDYFKKYTKDDFINLIRKAKPYYKYQYQDLGTIIEDIKLKVDNRLELNCVPFTKMDSDYMVMVSGDSGVGKTSYIMNIAHELVRKNIPCIVLPFERGIKTVGKRFLQIQFNKTEDEIIAFDNSDWEKVIPDIVNYPLYFSLPEREEIKDVVLKAKRLFGIKAVLVDHLDYNIVSGDNEVSEMKRVLLDWKNDLCIANDLIMFVVHHIKKPENMGLKKRKPRKEDLKGSSAAYQIPEVVIMLSEPEKDKIEVDVVKNKSDNEGSKIYEFKKGTGLIGGETKTQAEVDLDEF